MYIKKANLTNKVRYKHKYKIYNILEFLYRLHGAYNVGLVVFAPPPLPTARFSLIVDLDEQYFPHISHMWWTGSATSSNSTKLLLISLYKILITENILIDFNLCNKSFSNFIFINIYIFINFWSKEIFTESKIYIF